MTTQLTQVHAEALDHVLTTLAAGAPLDPQQHQALLVHNANQTGLTASRYPGLHAAIAAAPAALAAAAPRPGAFQANEDVVFVATNRVTRKLSARVVMTRTKPVAMMKVTVFVAMKQGATTVVLAHGQVVQFVGQTVQVDTDAVTALTVAPKTKVTVLTSWVINYQDGTTEARSHSVARTVKASTDPVIDAPVQRPGRTTGDLDDIVIGLSRGLSVVGRNEDVDYWFWQHESSNLQMLVPLQGSIRFKQAVADIGANNPALEFRLTLSEGGSSGLVQQDAQLYAQYFQKDPTDKSGRTVLFRMAAGVDSADSAINFGQSTWNAETRCYFTAKITGLYADLSDSEDIVVTSSMTADDNPLDGVAHIKPLSYVWHCLAAGTQIQLADGTTRPIEHITNADTVASGGGDRKVLATLQQPHHGPVTVLAFASGAVLTVSGSHPMITPSGAVQAASLAVGDHVRTHGTGHTTVAAVHTDQLHGEILYNLWLDPQRAGDTSMIANGITVGDHLMQGRLLRDHKTDPVKVRARLPPHLHKDHESWLEDQAKRAHHP